MVFYCKQKTAYEMRSRDWSSDVCSSDLAQLEPAHEHAGDLRPLVRDAGFLLDDRREHQRFFLRRQRQVRVARLPRRVERLVEGVVRAPEQVEVAVAPGVGVGLRQESPLR